MDKLQGGYLQQLAQLQERAEEPPPAMASKSKLATQLLESWAWGTISAPRVQAVAEAAVEDGLLHPGVQKLSKIGGQGRFPGNMHRDLTVLFGKPTLVNAISEYHLKLKIKKNVSEDMPVSFLLPHKLFSCMFHSMPSAFQASVLGGHADQIANFWKSMKDHPFVLARPETGADLHKLVPIALHGDGVSYMQAMRAGGKSMEALSWSSLLSVSPTKVSSFLMLLIAKSAVKDWGLDQTWPKAWRILCWSLTALASGKWPLKDWNNKDFVDEGSIDFMDRGRPLADGFGAIVFVLRSDLELLSNHFHLNSLANHPCAL